MAGMLQGAIAEVLRIKWPLARIDGMFNGDAPPTTNGNILKSVGPSSKSSFALSPHYNDMMHHLVSMYISHDSLYTECRESRFRWPPITAAFSFLNAIFHQTCLLYLKLFNQNFGIYWLL